jgi:CMP/dCMP kinase
VTVVTIDGPSGAGKSTVAQEVARRLGFTYLDTGALYRRVALAALQEGVEADDVKALESVATRIGLAVDDQAGPEGAGSRGDIRGPEVSRLASVVAAVPGVRKALAARQRLAAARGDVVIEGRDIGTAIAPDADVKVYLTASLDERARRRALQAEPRPDAGAVARVRADLAERDRADEERRVSPLTRPGDAVEIDSSHADVAEVVEHIVDLVRRLESSG